MSLWFKKKDTKEETIQPAVVTPEVKPDSVIPATESGLPKVGSVPMGPKPFRLPKQTTIPAEPAESDVSAAPIAPVAPSGSVGASRPVLKPIEASPVSPVAPTAPVEPVTPVASVEPVTPVASVAPAAPVAAGQSGIRIADRTHEKAAKTEVIGADKPVLQRTDPKVMFYQLMNALYDVILVLDDNGHVIDCNVRAEPVFGYSSSDVWDMPIDKIVYGMNSRMLAMMRKNLANKQHILIDARCFRSNGTSFLAEVGASLVQFARTENLVFAIRNVEKRKRSSDELRKLRATLDVVPYPAFACNLDGGFEVINAPVLGLLGITDEVEALQKRFQDLMPGMDASFKAALHGQVVEEKLQEPQPDGSTSVLTLKLRPLRTGQDITGVVGIVLF